jgi:hypothetical protein
VDLSPKMIRPANSLAAEAGLSESVTFELGDGAEANLQASDIVILGAVLCCYPDADSLVDNSGSASKRYYAISIPDDRRIVTRLMRILLPVQGVIFRRRGFRFFIHSKQQIRDKLEGKGFRLVSESAVGWFWSVLLFSLPAEP